jgi:hypothetical protein
MGYSAADEGFTHQLPRPFDQVHHPDGSWSDRCYFFVHLPDGSLLITNGYGNNPNQGSALGYGKVALADGRHWDLAAGRRNCVDRAGLYAGPMRWTCVEPLQHWRLDLEANDSGIEWELHYRPRAPMWELLPMKIAVSGRPIVDMYHMKESGHFTGWVQIEDQRVSVDGFHGGRDRTFGVRVADEINFWLWLDVGFEDMAIEAWVIESRDGTVQYVDGGITHVDGALSKRFVDIDHVIEFDGDRKRPARAVLVFMDEDGVRYRVTADSPHQNVNAYYGQPLPSLKFKDLGNGEYFLHFPWNSSDREQLVQLESRSMSIDQLMRFDLDGKTGHGVFEILSGSDGYQRYANWPAMDMSAFRQSAKAKGQ